MISLARRLLEFPGRLYRLKSQLDALRRDIDGQNLSTGRLHARLNRARPPATLAEAEFKVLSQYGDDGIIDHLINRTNPPVHKFVEFGVEDYSEANTRFLLVSRNWSGLIMDGRLDLEAILKHDPIYRRHDLKARSAFVTAENIDKLLVESGFAGEIGLLSIDIDGNDYWVWNAIRSVTPAIVVSEFNSVFGPSKPWTVPYDPAFNRTRYHWSNLVYGTSLTSLSDLAAERGYAFVGCNSAGNNAYFVRKDYLRDLAPLSPEEGYVEAKFSESRDQQGNWTFLKGTDRIAAIRGVTVFNTRKGVTETIQ